MDWQIKNKFLKKEQEELKKVFDKLNKKGCKVMLSNSNTKFIKDLYKNYKKHSVYRYFIKWWRDRDLNPR